MKVLVVSTSRKTRGGISAVIKLYEQSEMWHSCHCHWIGTHRDGNNIRKIFYYILGVAEFLVLLPFYDIVHFHISLGNTVVRKYPLFLIAKLFKKKTIIHLHCGSQIDNIWNTKYQFMFEKCDCGILLSESLKRKIEEHIGVSDKLHVVYNPCPRITRPYQRERKDYILFSGTLNEGKGYNDLIKAFSMVAMKHPEWKLLFAGNGDEERAKELAKELRIEDQVILLGWVNGEAKHKAFSQSKALCLPSYAEGFPMAVLDAWAYGLPVITTPVGGIPDVAKDGENMLLFNPGDINKLAECLDRIIEDNTLRENIANGSIKLASTVFNVDNICFQLSKIYAELLNHN